MKGNFKLSPAERLAVEQLIRSRYLSYPQIAERYGIKRFRVMEIARQIGVRRPRGTASPHHPLYRGEEHGSV